MYFICLFQLREELQQFGLMDHDAPLTYERLSNLVYLGDVIYETLRLDPPAGGAFRKANLTIELGVCIILFILDEEVWLNRYIWLSNFYLAHDLNSVNLKT